MTRQYLVTENGVTWLVFISMGQSGAFVRLAQEAFDSVALPRDNVSEREEELALKIFAEEQTTMPHLNLDLAEFTAEDGAFHATMPREFLNQLKRLTQVLKGLDLELLSQHPLVRKCAALARRCRHLGAEADKLERELSELERQVGLSSKTQPHPYFWSSFESEGPFSFEEVSRWAAYRPEAGRHYYADGGRETFAEYCRRTAPPQIDRPAVTERSEPNAAGRNAWARQLAAALSALVSLLFGRL